ncbi:MAG: rRNA maturation RNase YbeY [Pseudohongiellaceae bacterium]|nr:rRNA maturation RNase YbeY [Pseudohongiellaceae bacterium]
MSAMLEIQNLCKNKEIPPDADFEKWLATTLEALAPCSKPRQLFIRIVDEDESARLNKEYRHKDKPTNVLSFPSYLPEQVLSELPELPLGDLVICAAVVETEALEQSKEISQHWAHMVVHGTLHLVGYDHQEEKEAQEMESLEIDILSKLNIDNPYETH